MKVVLAFWFILIVTIPSVIAGDSPPPTQSQGLKEKMEGMFTAFLRRDLTIETLRWKFLARFVGSNVKLWEKPDLLMAEAPEVTMKVSLKTLTAGRYHIAKIRVKNAEAYIRFTHNGSSNLVSLVKDLVDHANKIRRPRQKQKAVYNLFDVQNAKFHVIDAEKGIEPFGEPFQVNAKGDINGLGTKTKFPFELEAIHLSTSTPMRVRLTGTMSNRPIVRVVANQIPLQKAEAYLPIVHWFTGEADAEYNFSKAGAYMFWKLRFFSNEIITSLPLPFPTIRIEGSFHAYRTSTLEAKLSGKSTLIQVIINILDFHSKKVALSIQSQGADIGECIEWCRTGSVLAAGPNLTGPLMTVAQSSTVWRLSGKADIDAQLHSVMGPKLIRKADGQVNLKIRDGVLTEMPGFIKMLQMLNLSSLLIPKDNQPEGLKFGSVTGTVDLNDGVAQTRGLIIIESPTLDVAMEGKVDFPNQFINARVLVGIVSVPSDVLKKIPLVRYFGKGEKKGVIPICISIQGPLRNPAVKIISMKSFKRELLQTLPEKIRIPEKVLQNIYKSESLRDQ